MTRFLRPLLGLRRQCNDMDVFDFSIHEAIDGLRIASDDNDVIRVSVDSALSLHLATDIVVSISQPFILYSEGGTGVMVPAGESFEVAAALPLLGDKVERLFAAESGELHITFGSGKRLEVPAGRPYENWQIYFPDGGWWVGLPGGGVSTYSPPATGLPEVHQYGQRRHPPDESVADEEGSTSSPN